MSDLKNELIKLGSSNPELKPQLRIILDTMDKEAGSSLLMVKDLIGGDSKLKPFMRDLRKQDPNTLKMLRSILLELEKLFDDNTIQAINRLRNLISRGSNDIGLTTNNLAKVTDLLGLKTPLDF